MLLEFMIMIETLISEHIAEISGIAIIAISLNFFANGGFKLFKKPPKVLVCPHAEEDD